MRYDLTVVKLDADTIDVTDMKGPPRVLIGGWVELTATNGEVTVTQRVPVDRQLPIGATYIADIEEDDE